MDTQLTRKAFCQSLLGGTVLLLVQSCGGGGSDTGSGTTPDGAAAASPATGTPATGTTTVPPSTGCSNTIADNHGHILTVAVADLDSPTDMVYHIQGNATHDHSVTLSVANLRALKAGGTVNTLSSVTELHQHSITVSCM